MKSKKESGAKSKSTKNLATAKFLVIVESPGKIRALSQFLGPEYRVKASLGHVRDLPKSKFGVDVENGFQPQYITVKGKSKVVSALKKEAQRAEKVFLAPDPDREGEAIAWHLFQLLGPDNDKFRRISYQEITAQAVRAAIDKPGQIDMRKVDAQTARRVLDRIMGYKLSPLLWEKVAKGLSAGRVQSVALLLICQREKEVDDFIPEEFWILEALLEKRDTLDTFWARLEKIDSRKAEVPDREASQRILSELEQQVFEVARIEEKSKFKRPPPPFITSQLQAEAARRFRWPIAKTMKVAQQLYEGVELGETGAVGLITYMRTDSYRVSPQALAETREFIHSQLGKAYLPPSPHFYRSKKGAQEAHEAIRPTNVGRTPDSIGAFLSKEQFLLYGLIWKRSVASQMVPARLRSKRVEIEVGRYLFVARDEKVDFPGFLKIYWEDGKEKSGGEKLPELIRGEVLNLKELKPEQKFTIPPSRYTEGTLVKVLEDNGVGRPSTYVPTIETLKRRDYIRKQEGKLWPTELGRMVNRLLQEHFPLLINVSFTAGMEEELDNIEAGKVAWKQVVGNFYQPFMITLARAEKEMKNLKRMNIPTDLKCEKCGQTMVIRWGRNGEFLACSAYPDCRNTKNFRRGPGGNIEIVEDEVTDRRCQKCGALMVVKERKYGKFLACSNYPQCKNIQPYPTGVKCPQEGCNGELVRRRSKKGYHFYGCSNYPQCKYVTRRLPKSENGDREVKEKVIRAEASDP